MKKLLYAIVLLPGVLQAQQIEFGLGGGISTNTKPSDNMYYKGEKLAWNYAAAAQIFYNITTTLQAGLEAHFSELSTASDKSYAYKTGYIGGDHKRFVFAKQAISVCAVFNAKLLLMRGYAYGGIAAGYGVGRHNSKDLGSNEAYRAPDGGNGEVLGAQIGYVLGLSNRFAFNAELAMRYWHLKYNAGAPAVSPSEDLNYHVLSFPLTIGLRYQLFDAMSREARRQGRMNIGGE